MTRADEIRDELLDNGASINMEDRALRRLGEIEKRKILERKNSLLSLQKDKVYKEKQLVEIRYVLKKLQAERGRENANLMSKKQEQGRVELNLKKEEEALNSISKKLSSEEVELKKEIEEKMKMFEDLRRKIMELEKREMLLKSKLDTGTRGIKSIISRLLGVIERDKREVINQEKKKVQVEQKILMTERNLQMLENEVRSIDAKIRALSRT